MDLQLGGLTALVTGGSRGIGWAIARELAREGATVAICGRSPDTIADAAERLSGETGARVLGLAADMGTRDAVVDLVACVTEALGPVQVLVNNAATAAGRARPPALNAVTREALLADELGPAGITVNCVHPGLTRTVRSSDVVDADEAARAAAIEDRIPRTNSIKRMVDASDLAPLVAFLASPLSFVLNGESIEAGGGVPGTIRY